MHLAVARLDVKTVVKLIMRQIDVNGKDTATGDTPLHLLMNVYCKNTIAARKILGFLVDYGAEFNAKNHDQWTPLHLAVRRGSLDIVEALLTVSNQNTLKQEALNINVQGGN